GLYARSLGCLAWNKLYASDFEAAWSLCQRGLEVARAVNDEGALIWNRYVEGLACLRTGKYDQAADCFDACLAYWGQNGAKFWQAKCLSNLGRTFYLWGKPEGAQHFLNRSLLLHTEVGDKLGMSISHSRLADVAAALDDYAQAERHLEGCLLLLGEFQPYWKATTLKKLGDVAGQRGQYHRAMQYFRDSLLIFKDTGVEFQAAETLISFSRVNLALGQGHQAWEQIREALRFALERHPVLMALKALLVVAALLHAEERYAGALELLAFVVAHPGADHHTRQEAERLLAALRPEVPAQAFARAQERAGLLDLRNIASQFL
ncbi:MAG TPA: tetratricopeptide repeat protein, partial [Anaerolineales bacterium]